jgi:hypothetical protein
MARRSTKCVRFGTAARRQATCCDEREPSYYELLQQAWVLLPGGRGKPARFVRASDLRDAEVDRFLSAMREEEE